MQRRETARYPCPCCGYLAFQEPPGSYATCPICAWEDDALQLEYATTLEEGANGVTLYLAQRDFAMRGGATGAAPPLGAPLRRDSAWRPIDPGRDNFEDAGALRRRPAEPRGEALYYWRPGFWRRLG